jgi:hypothetical protein
MKENKYVEFSIFARGGFSTVSMGIDIDTLAPVAIKKVNLLV